MTMKDEVFRAFFLAFGFLEIMKNSSYLMNVDGITLARKWHQELPKEVTDLQMQRKIVCMLIVGVAFFTTSMTSYLTHSFSIISYGVLMILYCLYALVEAIYYRYIRTTSATTLIIFVTVVLFL